MPFLTYPLALLALIAIPALATIYLLRNRFRRYPVSSLFLWAQQRLPKEGGTQVARLRLPPIFYLELAALIFLLLAAIGPWWPLAGHARPLLVILDDSASMQAIGPRGSPRDLALRDLRQRVRRHGIGHLRVVLAGTRVESLGATPASDADVLLTRWRAGQAVADLDRALGMLTDLGGDLADVLVLSDHAPVTPPTEGRRLIWAAFGTPLPNLAFVSAARTPAEDGDRVLLEIANRSPQPQTTTVQLRQGDAPPRDLPCTLAPGERQRLVLSVPDSGVLLATLPDDALQIDNRVQLPPAERPRIRAANHIADPTLRSLVQRALDASGLLDPSPGTPHLVFNDAPAVPPADPDTWAFTLHGGTDGARAFSGPFVIDGTHPLAAGLELPSAIWAAAPPEPAVVGALPVVAAGNVPLLEVRDDAAGRQLVHMHINPAGSTVHLTPNWPAIFWNVLEWRDQHLPGFAAPQIPLGADAVLRLPGPAATLAVIEPDGARRVLTPPGRTVALPTPIPGLYAAEVDGRRYTCAVNFLAEGESTLSHAATGTWGDWRDAESASRHHRDVTGLFLLLALLCLLLHLRLANRTMNT